MGTDKNKQKKYVSVRKALRELRVDEKELKKIVEEGGIKAYPDTDKKNVKFDADEIEKYRTSRVQSNEENPKIADESLYESADVSFDSLFVSQAQGRSAASLTEEIPQEPDILFGPSTPKQNIKDFLNKKKPEPVSPVKAIQSVRSRDKGTTSIVSFSLFIVIIMLISINSFLLLQIGSTPTLPQIAETKAISDELLPQMSIMGKVVPAETYTITALTSGKIKKLATAKLKKDAELVVIDNATTRDREQAELQQTLLIWELQKSRLSSLSSKAQSEIAQISEMYRQKNTLQGADVSSWKKNIESFAKSIKSGALDVWLQLHSAQQNYELAEKKWLQSVNSDVVKAPFDGQLLLLYAKVGSDVRAGDVIGEYHSVTNQLQVVMAKDEFRQVQMQNEVMVTLPNGEQQKGKIHGAVLAENLVKVKIDIKIPVNLGMQFKVTFPLKKIPECILVNRRAIFFHKDIRGKNQAMVCKVLSKKGKRCVYPTPVVIGFYDEDYVQILSGVDSGDVIAMAKRTPLENFTSGQQVQD